MSRPKIKQIKSVAELDNENDDEVLYYLQYSEDMTDIMLGIRSKQPLTPEEYVAALASFVDELSEHPQNLFVETVDHSEDTGLH